MAWATCRAGMHTGWLWPTEDEMMALLGFGCNWEEAFVLDSSPSEQQQQQQQQSSMSTAFSVNVTVAFSTISLALENELQTGTVTAVSWLARSSVIP